MNREDAVLQSSAQGLVLSAEVNIAEVNIIDGQPLILTVDDQDDNRMLSALILEGLGCSYISACDGETALELSRFYQPALILLDITLPHLSGVEVLQKLRQNPETSKIPIIAVTAMAMAGDRERLLAVGFDDYVSKPYTIEELEARIQHNLNSSSAPALC
ncbi:response regulator [Leptolyngbya sp. FACHB-261]|uniref:response regulator n=1 Tax=Leptolyngbya sp. FACHB-261 TaxID=2692806 RepID=UPI001689A9AE|nr:response regulator [Leptolyngbya sp. FACHB-261]MBD2101093.1 response regulator [Leptolyngbya sp. FACHB-261]